MTKLHGLLLLGLAASVLSGCVAWGQGIAPVEPPGRKIFPSPTVESLQPTLTWEAADPEEMPGARYHLVVFRLDGFPAREVTVYSQRDLTETSHTLDTPLLPGTRYHWRIGVTYSNGKETRTEWNSYRAFTFSPSRLFGSSGSPPGPIPSTPRIERWHRRL